MKYQKEYQKQNKEYISTYHKEYNKLNEEILSQKGKEYRNKKTKRKHLENQYIMKRKKKKLIKPIALL